MKRTAAATLPPKVLGHIKATITGTKTIRDKVMFIGNDFFQLLMLSPDLKFVNCLNYLLKRVLTPSAFSFAFLTVALGSALSARALDFQARKAQDFQTLQKDLETPGFWHKPKLWKQVKDERKIPVSVIKKDKRWSFKGAGLVEVPRAFAFEKAKDLNRLREIPENFKEVRFDAATSKVKLKIHFLNQDREMTLQLSEEVLKDESRIFFQSVHGWLPGMEGVLVLKDQGRQMTETQVFALYPGKISWVPDWVFSVAAEGVMHHVAQTLRKSLESDYKK